MTTIHVRYEILDDPGRPHPDSVPDSFAWGVQAVGLPGNLSAFGVGDTLADALDDLGEGIRALFSTGPVPGGAEKGDRRYGRRCGLMPVRLSGKDIVKALGKGGWDGTGCAANT